MRTKSRSGLSRFYFPKSITEAMSEVFNYPLTLVEAPMGYGKTTAVKEELGRQAGALLWLRVYDHSLSSLWVGFCRLFSEYDDKIAHTLMQMPFPTDGVSLGAVFALLEEIPLPEGSVVALDDYHLVAREEVNRFIELLAQYELPNLHIVLTARYCDFPNREELKLKGYLKVVSKGVFEWSTKDIRDYFRQCGVDLKLEEAQSLHDFTEGWISALYLLMRSKSVTGSDSGRTNIFSLVEQVVFNPLTERQKDFLLNMCVFDSFTNAQSEYIWTEDDGGAALIAELVKKNAFVAYDTVSKRYIMHSILKSLLLEKLEERHVTDRTAIYKKAAKWHHGQGEYLTAMRYAHLAGDFESLLESFEKDRGRSIDSESKELIIKYFEACPQECRQRFPFAMLVYARRLFTFNEMDRFKKVCAELNVCFDAMSDILPEERNQLMGEYQLMLSFSGYNDIEKMSEFHQRACSLMQKPSAILDSGNSWTFGSPSVLYMFHRKSGDLKRYVDVISRAMPFYYQCTSGHGNGAEYVMAAEYHYLTGDWTAAEIMGHKAYKVASEAEQSGVLIASIFLQIRLALAKGEFDEVREALERRRVDVEAKQWHLFMHTLDMCDASVYGILKVPAQVPSWISQGDFANVRIFFPTMPFLNMVYGRVMLINGQYARLIACTEDFLRMASIFPNLLAQIYIHIHAAAASFKLLRMEDGLGHLRQALDLAMPDGLVMPFVENADQLDALMDVLRGKEPYKEMICQIEKLAVPYWQSIDKMVETHFSEKKPELTKREMEIVRLAAEGYSNKMIGKQLFISENTVKSQLKVIFEKLGIRSRALLKPYIDQQ